MKDENTRKCFIVFAIKSRVLGRIEIELFQNKAPRTTTNFIELLKKKKGEGYLGSTFHRIIPGFMIQGGDYERGDGTGGSSIYGRYFEDENLELKHDEPGLLSMANAGPDTNGSQFFITLDYLPHLDGKHVVFGRVTKGMDIIKHVEKLGSDSGQVKDVVKIVDCGVV